MDHAAESSIIASTSRILHEIRFVGALGEILQLLEGSGATADFEPDCLGVVGREIAERMAGVLDAVLEIHETLDADRDAGARV